MFDRLRRWAHGNMPTRETFENNRVLRPIAHRVLRPELWRFHRRSVARGVALGVFVGVVVPVAQTVFAALLSLPARANVPVAAVTTFITNPLTTPPIWAFSWWVGRGVMRALGPGRVAAAMERGGDVGWLDWALHDVGPALGVGLIVVAVVGAALGYVLASFGWRCWIGAKWAHRCEGRA